MAISNLHVGGAGEYLVVADLLTNGYKAFLTSQLCPYDVVFDANGRLYRIQVRSTQKPRGKLSKRGKPNTTYAFPLHRGARHTNYYTNNEIDLFAFVALDTKTIAYVPVHLVVKKGQPARCWTAYAVMPTYRRVSAVRLITDYSLSRALEQI